MIVKVGKDSFVRSDEHPIIVIFEKDEIDQIKNFEPEHQVLYSYPIESDPDKIEKWVEERLNQEPYGIYDEEDEEETE